MPDTLMQLLADAGVAGIAVAIIAYLFLQVMKNHKEERGEWREDIKEDRHKSNEILKELTSVIRDIKSK